jgi:hypothetical protein
MQRERVKSAELKLGVMHEGWEPETPAKRRFRLVNKTAWAGFMPARTFWERAAVRFAQRYDAEKVSRVIVNGDGAEWIKEVRKQFDGVECYLDPFHRNKAIRQGLGFDQGLVRRAMAAVKHRDLKGLDAVLNEGVSKAVGDEQAQQVKDLRRYLHANRDGLLDWRGAGLVPEGARSLGASEGEINHVLAARMKKRGMSWGTAGAHRVALLRCLDAEGRLADWLETGWQDEKWPEAKRIDGRHAPSKVIESLADTDSSEALAGHLPLLATAAGNSELGRRLKQLVENAPASELVHRTLWPWPRKTA